MYLFCVESNSVFGRLWFHFPLATVWFGGQVKDHGVLMMIIVAGRRGVLVLRYLITMRVVSLKGVVSSHSLF